MQNNDNIHENPEIQRLIEFKTDSKHAHFMLLTRSCVLNRIMELELTLYPTIGDISHKFPGLSRMYPTIGDNSHKCPGPGRLYPSCGSGSIKFPVDIDCFRRVGGLPNKFPGNVYCLS